MNICKILRAISAASGIVAGALVIYLGAIIADQARQALEFNGEMATKVGLLALFALIAGGNLAGWSIKWLWCVCKPCCHTEGHKAS
ncbi:MAG: hypothetical protein QM537_08990 [Candidatus Symbiobacter sp.]|nr:hypothetical protein [Candidatus Symbiobacter sp.]